MAETDDEEILKGKHHYKVVWEDKLPVEKKKPAVHEHISYTIHSHPESKLFIIGSIVFLLLVYLSFVNISIFWIFLSLFIVVTGIVTASKKKTAAHMEIDHPIRTGFEIAIGMSLFFSLVLIVVAIIIAILAGTVLSGLWETISAIF